MDCCVSPEFLVPLGFRRRSIIVCHEDLSSYKTGNSNLSGRQGAETILHCKHQASSSFLVSPAHRFHLWGSRRQNKSFAKENSPPCSADSSSSVCPTRPARQRSRNNKLQVQHMTAIRFASQLALEQIRYNSRLNLEACITESSPLAFHISDTTCP